MSGENFTAAERFVEQLDINQLDGISSIRLGNQFKESTGYDACESGVFRGIAKKGFAEAKQAFVNGDQKAVVLGLGITDQFMTAHKYPIAQVPDCAAGILGTTKEELSRMIRYAHPDIDAIAANLPKFDA